LANSATKTPTAPLSSALRLEVAGFLCLTNLAASLSKERLSHQEVLEVGKKSAAQFGALLRAAS